MDEIYTAGEVILDTGTTTTSSNYTSAVLAVGQYRLLKMEVTGVAFTAGTTPSVDAILEDWIAGGTVQAGQVGVNITQSNSLGVLMMGEGLPTTTTSTWLANITKAVLAFNRVTHCRFEININGSPTNATYRARLIGFT